MKTTVRRALQIVNSLGFDPVATAKAISGLPKFVTTCLSYRRQQPPSEFRLRITHLRPILTDFDTQAGNVRTHYFHQDLWAARKIYRTRPQRHYDIGSRIDGFIAHLLVFMDVSVVDISPLAADVRGLRFVHADATKGMDAIPSNSVESLSSLHAAEHFGLGRYSDPIDAHAHERFALELQRLLAYDGRLYFAVPIGKECLEFNAHRIFSVRTVLRLMQGLRLTSFSYVDEAGMFHEDASVEEAEADYNMRFGCGLFEFSKPAHG